MACEGAGIYYATGIAAEAIDRFLELTLYLGDELPHDDHGLVDYEGLVDTMDHYFVDVVGVGKQQLRPNVINVVRECYDRDHDDNYISQHNFRPSVEWVSSLVIVDSRTHVETIEEGERIKLLGRVGIWLPLSGTPGEPLSARVVKSLRGGHNSVAYVALNGMEEFIHREVELPGEIFDEQ
ncbi:MAG TPA: hypothetical protein VFI84_03030 [Candidatus Saccharimonadales bacterium]|nr:hypothetical protein [Candidatus Saccharimonadales bacterium]